MSKKSRKAAKKMIDRKPYTPSAVILELAADVKSQGHQRGHEQGCAAMLFMASSLGNLIELMADETAEDPVQEDEVFIANSAVGGFAGGLACFISTESPDDRFANQMLYTMALACVQKARSNGLDMSKWDFSFERDKIYNESEIIHEFDFPQDGSVQNVKDEGVKEDARDPLDAAEFMKLGSGRGHMY